MNLGLETFIQVCENVVWYAQTDEEAERVRFPKSALLKDVWRVSRQRHGKESMAIYSVEEFDNVRRIRDDFVEVFRGLKHFVEGIVEDELKLEILYLELKVLEHVEKELRLKEKEFGLKK